jgi:hypothetical protein
MGIISRGLAAGASEAADLLAKDYERGQDVAAKKDLADYEANIRQRLQDAVNQFTLHLEDVKKQHQSELLQQRNQFEKDLQERKLEQESQFHQDTVELKSQELQLLADRLAAENARYNALLKHYSSLANAHIVQGDDGLSYYMNHEGKLVPVTDASGKPVKVSGPKDFQSYATLIKSLVDSQVITPQQAKEMMARFLTGGNPNRVQTPEEAGSPVKKEEMDSLLLRGMGNNAGGNNPPRRKNPFEGNPFIPPPSPFPVS